MLVSLLEEFVNHQVMKRLSRDADHWVCAIANDNRSVCHIFAVSDKKTCDQVSAMISQIHPATLPSHAHPQANPGDYGSPRR
jgi:hypothetical protein